MLRSCIHDTHLTHLDLSLYKQEILAWTFGQSASKVKICFAFTFNWNLRRFVGVSLSRQAATFIILKAARTAQPAGHSTFEPPIYTTTQPGDRPLVRPLLLTVPRWLEPREGPPPFRPRPLCCKLNAFCSARTKVIYVCLSFNFKKFSLHEIYSARTEAGKMPTFISFNWEVGKMKAAGEQWDCNQ